MITQLSLEQVTTYITDDPVRPHIPAAFRVSDGRQVWALFEDKYSIHDEPSSHPLAIICVAYTNAVPRNELELEWFSAASSTLTAPANIAVFYTVWSYDKGAGQQIVRSVARMIQDTRADITRWVTLSPLTEMAERFHTKNGARFLERYETAQTFEYTHVMKKFDILTDNINNY